jgi:hypothetical protein
MGLFQRICAMRDHDALGVGARQMMRAALRQAPHHVEIHILAIDLRHLLADEITSRQRFAQPRHALQQRTNADLRGGIACVVAAAGCRARNRAACA